MIKTTLISNINIIILYMTSTVYKVQTYARYKQQHSINKNIELQISLGMRNVRMQNKHLLETY